MRGAFDQAAKPEDSCAKRRTTVHEGIGGADWRQGLWLHSGVPPIFKLAVWKFNEGTVIGRRKADIQPAWTRRPFYSVLGAAITAERNRSSTNEETAESIPSIDGSGFDLEIKRPDIGVSVFPASCFAGKVPPQPGCFVKTRVRTEANGQSEMRFIRLCRFERNNGDIVLDRRMEYGRIFGNHTECRAFAILILLIYSFRIDISVLRTSSLFGYVMNRNIMVYCTVLEVPFNL